MKKAITHDFSSLVEELDRLRCLAETARSTDGDSTEKWKANGELVSWLRTNCFTILSAIEAGADLSGHVSGNAKQRLYNSLVELKNGIVTE